MNSITAAIESACSATGLSQRRLARRAGLSQSTLSRILSGGRTPTMTELILLADATGCTVAQLTGSDLAGRVTGTAAVVEGSPLAAMQQRLLHFLELDASLSDHDTAP
jgi:transcriptional regulator with XRE-family HTH domain